jgi:hypothetical protein
MTSEESNNLQAKARVKKDNWTRDHRFQLIQAAASLISVVVAGAALFQGHEARDTARKTRLEARHSATMSNAPFTEPSWKPWLQTEARTLYVGLQREMIFATPFANEPLVTTALSLIALSSSSDLMDKIGYAPATAATAERARAFHVLTFVKNVRNDRFVLAVGIGLPTEAGAAIKRYLSDTVVNPAFAREMVANNNLASSTEILSPDDRWFCNFAQVVGAIDVSWFARAYE